MNLEEVDPADIGNEQPLFAEDGLGLDSIDALEPMLPLKKTHGGVIEANDENNRRHLGSIASPAQLIEDHRRTA